MKLSNFSDLARVVILDDREDEGKGIKEALESVKIPSLFYHVTSNRVLDDKLCKNIRLVFLDLIFSDSRSTNPAQNAGNALSKLSKIVGKNEFYVLVIWSSHTTEDVATAFKAQMERQVDFARPYAILALQKSDFRTSTGKFRIKSIISKINEQLAQLPSLQVFTDWERLTTNSISEVAGSVAGQKEHSELSRVINSLSEAYAGKSKLKDVPKNALMAFNEIFRGIVSQQIISNGFGTLYRKIAAGTLNDPEKAKLNTSLMFTPDVNPGPGSIFKIKGLGKNKEKFVTAILDQNKTTLGSAYEKIIPIAIEVTPLCNAAQGNAKHAYFLNGLVHPKLYPHGTGNKEVTIKGRSPHCYTLEKAFWDDANQEACTLSFNLKLFHSTLADNYVPMNKKIRDNLVIDLQHQVSGYISRPGHVLL